MCERKITSEREFLFKRFCSNSPSIKEQKNFTPQNHSLFCSNSSFGVTKITTSIWLQENENVKGVCVCGVGGSNFQNRPSHNEYVSTTVSVNRILGD